MALLGTLDAYNYEKVYMSIYHLIAIISEFMRYCKNNPNEEDEALVAQLMKLGQYRNHIEPTKNEPDLGRTEKSQDWDVLSSTGGTKILEDLSRNMKTWYRKKKNLNISVQQLDRIFTRFYYTAVHIDEQNIYTSVGAKFSDIIIAFINAALVESAVEEGISGINLNNIGRIEYIFIENWQKMQQHLKAKNQYAFGTFAYWLSSCPLLRMYINPMLLNLMKNHHDDDSQMLSEVLAYGADMDRKDNLNIKKQQAIVQKDVLSNTYSRLNAVLIYKKKEKDVRLQENLFNLAMEQKDQERIETAKAKLEQLENVRDAMFLAFEPFDVDAEYFEGTVNLNMDEDEFQMIYDEIRSKMVHADGEVKQVEAELDKLEEKLSGYSSFVMGEYTKVTEQPQSKTSLYTIYSKLPLGVEED